MTDTFIEANDTHLILASDEPDTVSLIFAGFVSSQGAAAVGRAVQALPNAGTVTPDIDNFGGGVIVELSQPTTLANPVGTPSEFQQYIVRVRTTVPRAWTFGSKYRGSSSQTLPLTTSGSGQTDYYGFQYNALSDTWDLLAKSVGY